MKHLLHDNLLRSTVAVLSATALAVACLPKEEKKDDDRGESGFYSYSSYSYGTTYSDARGDSSGFGPADVTVAITDEGVTVRLVDPPSPMTFGFAQTGDCEGDTCWLAESCASNTSGPAVCHDITSTQLQLAHVSAADHLVPSSTTMVTPALLGALTFVLDGGDACYTWGHNPDFYAQTFGCTVW
jgi:hypothetical protein